MPTIDWIDAIRVVIYPNDHRPAHVHTMGHGCEAVFCLNCPNGPVVIRENHGFSSSDARHIRMSLMQRLKWLCDQWGEIHDTKKR